MFKKKYGLENISLKTPLQIADMPLSRMKNTTTTKKTQLRSAVTCIRILYRDEYLSFLAIKTQMKGMRRNIFENLQSQLIYRLGCANQEPTGLNDHLRIKILKRVLQS